MLRLPRVDGHLTCDRGVFTVEEAPTPPPYPQQFRERVLARLAEPGVTVDQVAREFGINRNSVRNWKRQRPEGVSDGLCRSRGAVH